MAGPAWSASSCSLSAPSDRSVASWREGPSRGCPAAQELPRARIADTYHAWRGAEGAGGYPDEPGFCKSAEP
ncbi:MAG: hypothetical protein F4X76_10095 [Chloroflexi bacterium]|nr:hypothetical protein [Chloroflexota bacterium]